ncbi:hypothetical protein C8J56DRAFT_901838 [Mycena floridula]|nr:hypothetical protein C8J56DRAFT_901838 [Mycena floridula]
MRDATRQSTGKASSGVGDPLPIRKSSSRELSQDDALLFGDDNVVEAFETFPAQHVCKECQSVASLYAQDALAFRNRVTGPYCIFASTFIYPFIAITKDWDNTSKLSLISQCDFQGLDTLASSHPSLGPWLASTLSLRWILVMSPKAWCPLQGSQG